MIRSIATTTFRTLKAYNVIKIARPMIHNPKYNISCLSLNKKIAYQFADYPKH